MTARPQPFTVHVADDDIAELRRRLSATRLADDFANEDGRYGLRAPMLRELIDHWGGAFDWRAQEEQINAHPQFLVDFDGIPVHFLHVRGRRPGSIPIILTHGWPWTFWDWRGVIGLLTDPEAHGMPDAPSFDVVIPSLPGFGFSSPLRTPIGCRGTAVLWDRLMHDTLGYQRYAAAGGDWGAKVTGEIGQLFPDRVIGVYMLMLALPGRTAPLDGPDRFAPEEQWMIRRMEQARPLVTSHLAVQRHDPQTLAYALDDSPAGMAAWIWERRLNWSDPERLGTLESERDFLCTTASLYWHTRTIGTSMRFYRENFGDALPEPLGRITVPTAYGTGPHDLVYMPRAEAEAATDLRRWSMFPAGGHFAPNEVPDRVAREFGEFFGSLR